MADLIDKTIKDLKWYLDTNEEKGVVYFPKFCIENMIKNLKQADTERHAHWIVVGGDLGYVDCKCSACGYTDCFDDESELYNYCPECGKKMDEVEE